MHVDFYEKIWMWASGVLIAAFLAAILLVSTLQAVQPPSHVETIDPATISDHPEFGSPGIREEADGSITVSLLTEMFYFTPDPIVVPAGRPVTFRITSSDVIHGFHVVGTYANAMAIPGYVNQFTMTFEEPGEHLVLCHEYCGLLHHNMMGKLIVEGPAPSAAEGPAPSDVEGPAPSDVEGPAPSDVEGMMP